MLAKTFSQTLTRERKPGHSKEKSIDWSIMNNTPTTTSPSNKNKLHPHLQKLRSESLAEFEKQQPIIKELVTRFNNIENKRESFKVAASRPPPPQTPKMEKRKTRNVFITMESALADRDLRQHFRDFIDAAYAVENLDFWEACEKYENTNDLEGKKQIVKHIVNEFVKPSASNQVNLSADLATKITKAVEKGDSQETVEKYLQKAQQDILLLMQTNFFDRFLAIVGQPSVVEESEGDLVVVVAEPKEEKPPQFKEWVKRRHHKTGEEFYENTVTGVTMWDLPRPIVSTLPPPPAPPPYF